MSRVEAAEQRMKAGTSRSFNDDTELLVFLERLKTEERRASATFPIYDTNKHSTPPHPESRPFYISI